ncbi:DUF2461 domain-containing protein [Marinoscillum sp.]|uniref:DUF2461 domain-containing protein n=1 Tax=Marinoscillum sp. TaxID=2024838 RepID=UPI003BAACD28
MPISKANFRFLNELRLHNNREWFADHKHEYGTFHEEVKALAREVEVLMNEHDLLAGGRVYRIYRDVRFSKDKTPYKDYWAGSFRRATALLRGGYYYEIAPGRSFVAGGFFGPNASDLLHIRKQISQDPEPLWEVLNQEDFKQYFGGLKGASVKTSPKGFSIDDPAIALIRQKQFVVEHYFTDAEVLSTDFSQILNDSFRAMRPYLNYMSEILTTDLNGESIV